jgi:hypothetical protein
MPIFYKGAGVGTYWHTNDARVQGFTPCSATIGQTPDRLMQHIARGNTFSPYISLTRSYGVAWDYAMNGRARSTQANPGYVYEIEINDPLPAGMLLLDPIKVVADHAPSPLAPPYQHDGRSDFLLSVIDTSIVATPVLLPAGGATPRQPNLTIEIETLVRVLRDAEILANIVPRACVSNRIDVW